MNKFLRYLLILLVFPVISSPGQDLHFSQFSSFPVFYNPSTTGFINENIRVGIACRNQGFSIGAPYQTYAASGDAAFQPAFLKNDWFGIGVGVLTDKAGEGSLQKTSGLLSAAYHKSLDKWGNFKASLGFSLGLVNRSVDYNSLTFGNQWNGNQFDPGISSGENYTASSFLYLDLDIGIMVSYRVDRTTYFFSGISLDHVNNPSETFYNTAESVDWRWVFHGNGCIGMTDELIANPGFYFTWSNGITETLLGSMFTYGRKDLKFNGGLWYRWNRNIIPMAGVDYHGYIITLSYDLTVSSLRYADYMQGGIELSVQKNFKFHTTGSKHCENLRF